MSMLDTLHDDVTIGTWDGFFLQCKVDMGAQNVLQCNTLAISLAHDTSITAFFFPKSRFNSRKHSPHEQTPPT